MDSISSAIDTISGASGGNAQEAKGVEAVFHIGEQLETPEPRELGNYSVKGDESDNNQNQLGSDAATEFVHFGRTHADLAPRFPHSDAKLAHGVMFRDALEREALLLHGSIECAKGVFQEHKDSQGAVGMAGAAMDVLMGSGSTGLDPKRFDELINRVTKAGGTINALIAEYPPVHLAGIDLHKARANYQDFVKQMADEALKHKSGGGPGGAIGGALGAVSSAAGSAVGGAGGSIMKIASTVQGIVFKPFDIYLAMYLAVREEYEDVIDNASYAMTLKAIRAKSIPSFHVWFKPPPPPKEEEAAAGGGSDPVTKAINDAKEEVDKAVKAVKEKVDAVKDFLSVDAPEDPTPGDEALATIMAAFTSGAMDKRLPDGKFRRRVKVVPLLTGAIGKTIGVEPLPGFIVKVIDKIVTKDIGLLTLILRRAQQGGLTMTFSDESLRTVGREYFFDTLLDILVDTFSFLKDSPEGLFSVQGQKITKEAFLQRGRDLLNDKFGHYLNTIIDLAMKNAGDRLRKSIDGARDKNALTMEVLLARLPEVAALLARDTILPFFDLLFEQVFGKIMGGVTSAMSPVKSMMGDAAGVMNDVKKTKDKVKNVVDALGSGMAIDQNTDFEKLGDDLLGDKKKDDKSTKGGNFPGGKREILCSGKEITADEITKVEGEQKVDAKVWPDPPPAENAPAPAPAAA